MQRAVGRSAYGLFWEAYSKESIWHCSYSVNTLIRVLLAALQILVTFVTCLRAGIANGMGLPEAQPLVVSLEQYIYEVNTKCLDVQQYNTARPLLVWVNSTLLCCQEYLCIVSIRQDQSHSLPFRLRSPLPSPFAFSLCLLPLPSPFLLCL